MPATGLCNLPDFCNACDGKLCSMLNIRNSHSMTPAYPNHRCTNKPAQAHCSLSSTEYISDWLILLVAM